MSHTATTPECCRRSMIWQPGDQSYYCQSCHRRVVERNEYAKATQAEKAEAVQAKTPEVLA